MRVIDGQQLLDFMEIIEDRHGQKATIMISQLPVSGWYEVMKGNTTAADAILDRLVHTSVRFELKGASLRQKRMSNSTESEKMMVIMILIRIILLGLEVCLKIKKMII